MHILFTRFPLESCMGGAEVQTLALMKGLQQQGHTVAFLGSCPVLLEETSKLKIENGKLKIGAPPVTKWDAVSFLWRQCTMRKSLNFQFSIFHSQFDAVVMLSLSEKLLLTPYLHKQGIKVIWVEHDRVGPWLTHNPWLRRLKKLSRFATIIVVSDLSKKIYEQLGFANVVAIPNGIDTSRLCAKEKGKDYKQNAVFRIGTIARLSKDKGVDVLIEAVKDLPDVSLTIVGMGAEESILKAQSLKLKACTFLPHIDDLAEFYQNLDLFILPSRDHDPFGLVAGEAMMLGIPVIVTDACGIAGYLTHGQDAEIVRAGSVKELQKAIADMKNNPEKIDRMGTAGKCTSQAVFSMENMVQQYEQLLK